MGVEAQPEDENLCGGTPSDVDKQPENPKLFPALTSTSRLNLGQDWSEKTTGSSIELSFCDSRAKETSPKAEDRATAIPTAEEVLFRLEHFLVFE